MVAANNLAEAGQGTVVLLCSDAARLLPVTTITDVLWHDAPGARVVEVPDLCRPFSAFADALQRLRPSRAVVACAYARPRRDRILEVLRSSGAHLAGVQLVDLIAAAGARTVDAGIQARARLRAALAGVGEADLAVPLRERAVPVGSARVSRRDLFKLGRLPHRQVVVWAAERCQGHGLFRPCVQACPRKALSLDGGAVHVDEEACTGCGACVAACRTGAMTLGGPSLAGLEAAARVLAEEAGRLGAGVEIRCRSAEGAAPLGGQWLPLEVPSLEMVSAGWAFQFMAAGIAVKLTGCADSDCADSDCADSHRGDWGCAGRAQELARFAGHVARAVAPTGPPNRRPGRLTLREPEATVEAVACLASGIVGPWWFGSPAAPLGDVEVEPARCSLCGTCALACPAGALSVAEDEEAGDGARSLLFDASRCAACGVCSKSCPEGALSLTRAVASTSLAGGPRTLADGRRRRCSSCGALLGGGLPLGPLVARLAATHPELARRLQAEPRCADCLLVGSQAAGRRR
jgi:ferredoxin